MKNSKALMDQVVSLYRRTTRLSEDDLQKMLADESTFQYGQALKFGFIEGEMPNETKLVSSHCSIGY